MNNDVHGPKAGVIAASSVAIRLLNDEADAAALQAVLDACGDYFAATTGVARPSADAAVREIRGCLATPGREIALLVPNGAEAPVGALGWWGGSPEPDVALLGLLLVVPAHRGRHLAHDALSALEHWLGSRGIRRLRAGIAFGDPRAHAVSRALGFREMEQRTHVSVADQTRLMITLYEKPIGEALEDAPPLSAPGTPM